MEVINSVKHMKETAGKLSVEGRRIGLVPTMGYLHEGHMSLIQKCREENDAVIVSIFVNPVQFGQNEDFEKYPRDVLHDIKMLKEADTDFLFMPYANDMYGKDHGTFIEVKGVSEQLCGGRRPGHFSGVSTVVAKLFNICIPSNAYFGQKDYQQTVVIRKMTRELNFDITISVCPTVREKDGLAMSSRNIYLNPEQRSQAPIIYQALKMAAEVVYNGEKDSDKVRELFKSVIGTMKDPVIDYIEIRDRDDLADVEIIDRPVVIAAAVYIGKTRLIDNIMTGGADDADKRT